jgi:hypothetical protein
MSKKVKHHSAAVRLTDLHLHRLLAAVPTPLPPEKREELRARVEQAIADARRCERDFAMGMTTKQVQAKLKPLRTHLQGIRCLLRDSPALLARLNWYADALAATSGRGCELIFDPDPAKGLSVKGRNLIRLSVENILFLEELTTELQSLMTAPERLQRRSNRSEPHLNFLCSALMLVFKEVVGASHKLNAASYNQTTDRGSPLVEFVRQVFRLIGASDDGDRVKQRIIQLKAKAGIRHSSIRSTFPIHI